MKNKKMNVTGWAISLMAGILSAVCGFYWLVKALVYDDTNLPAILSSITAALFLALYAGKR